MRPARLPSGPAATEGGIAHPRVKSRGFSGGASGAATRHNHDKLPIALFGGGGGALNPGAHLVMEKETPLNNLLLTLIHRLGCQPTPFGDATDLLEMV
ncbi:MAG: hypothetical protein H8E15_10550 [Planctomycetes bacterium]|nr:hypothetical protein [Planctomycetota bacterium]